MEHTALGSERFQVSRIGFGGCPMGGYGWGHVDSADLLDAIAYAIDHGVNFFDTADVYGLGRSEEILAQGLRGRRDGAFIATKFGVRVENGRTWFDNTPAWIHAALDASLRRLATDRIDLYQLHYWDGHTPIEDIAATLEEVKRKGKIRAWGLTNVPLTGDLMGRPEGPPASFSYEFSLARRARETEILGTVRQCGATFLSWGSLGQGVLTGKYDASSRFPEGDRRNGAQYVNFSEAGRRRNLKIVDVLRKIRSRVGGRTLPQIALRWILDRVPGSVALIGIKRRAHIADGIGATGWNLSAADMIALDAVSAFSFRTEIHQENDARTAVETLA